MTVAFYDERTCANIFRPVLGYGTEAAARPKRFDRSLEDSIAVQDC
jgi:hypothetical protein